MARAMYPYRWADGTWRDEPEAKPIAAHGTLAKPRKLWTPTGFFKDGPNAARQAAWARNSRAFLYREWLRATFTEPTPARVVLELAAHEGLSLWGVARARRRLGVKTIRAGGRGTGQRNPWVWQFPVSK